MRRNRKKALYHVDDNDDDDDDDDDKLFLWYDSPRKDVWTYFWPWPLLEILTIANLRHAETRVWTCAEPELMFSWMKLYSSNNHYIITFCSLNIRNTKNRKISNSCYRIKYNIICSICFEWFSVCLEGSLHHKWSLSKK